MTANEPARVFISYRTSDGADKATALARELNAAFGESQVFLDKEDLPAGLPWREAIGATLDAKPVLLLLVTPQTFAAERIADANDPVRREVGAALAFGAHVIPLLADGVEQLPAAATLPPPLDTLGERTWRRLRAYDWREDVERLVADLEQLGLQRAARAQAQIEAARRRWFELGFSFAAGTLLGGAAIAGWLQRGSSDGSPGSALAGAWLLRAAPPATDSGSRLDAVRLHLAVNGAEVQLVSDPIDVRGDPAWAGFIAQWQQRFSERLDSVVWRGSGSARLEPGLPPAIDIALRVETPATGNPPIETGNLRAELDADAQRMSGRVWLNSEQVERSAQLSRAPT